MVVGRRLSLDITYGDAFSYIDSVKEAFLSEPAKYNKFLSLLKDCTANRVNDDITIAKVAELLKDHRKLLLGFSVFLPAQSKRIIPPDVAKMTIPPEATRTISPEAKRIIPPEAKMTIPPKAKRTISPEAKRIIFLKAEPTIRPKAKPTILPQPERIIFLKAEPTISPKAKPTILSQAKRIIFLKAEPTISPEAKPTIPPKAKPTILPVAKRTISPEAETETDSVKFMKKLQTRFRSLDKHVVESFRELMISFNEGEKSEKELHEEVVDLLYYHEDLIEDFFQIASSKRILWRQYLLTT